MIENLDIIPQRCFWLDPLVTACFDPKWLLPKKAFVDAQPKTIRLWTQLSLKNTVGWWGGARNYIILDHTHCWTRIMLNLRIFLVNKNFNCPRFFQHVPSQDSSALKIFWTSPATKVVSPSATSCSTSSTAKLWSWRVKCPPCPTRHREQYGKVVALSLYYSWDFRWGLNNV